MKINWDFIGNEKIISEAEYKKIEAIQEIMNKEKSMLGWKDVDVMISSLEVEEIWNLSKMVRNACDVFIVIGVGGSYLGSKAIIDALRPYFSKSTPEIIFAGHQLSSEYLSNLLEYIEGKRVFLNVISKSGKTLEPTIAFQKLYTYLKKHDLEYMKHVVVTTDSESGFLSTFAKKEGLKVLNIPREVGGRFSVLSAAGLFPISVFGVDIKALLQGARSMEGCFFEAAQYAIVRKHMEDSLKFVEAYTFYEEKLSSFAAWLQQLFAETQGKNKKGILPIINPNTTNLHSIGQYFQEGRDILFETVLRVEKTKDLFLEEYSQTMHQINQIVLEQVAYAHVEGNTPSIIVTIDSLTPMELGKLIYFFEMSAAIGGYLLDVDPFNQPGVDAYKKLVNQELKKL
ncbi:MAG: glucose-6-phosphate isomerase [Bacilli bacterium]|nr:glucose-6-phosphate isomerase [Bacilli bacterium]